MTTADALTGFLVVDKPPGITSHDVVSVVRALLRTRRVGHTGTLDPFATGVLPIAVGRSTRLIQFLDEREKVYLATVALGTQTDTGDRTGSIVAEAEVPASLPDRLSDVLDAFTGALMQKPHPFSAVKVNGKRLYEYARAGETVEIEPRPIQVDGWEIVAVQPKQLVLRVRCSRGTYVRVLAEDIARALGTVGHLTELRREQSGPFGLSGSVDFSTLSKIAAERPDWQAVLCAPRGGTRVEWGDRNQIQATVASMLIPPLAGLSGRLRVELAPSQVRVVSDGGRPPAPPHAMSLDEPYLLTHEGRLIAVAAVRVDGPRLLRVFARQPAVSSSDA